MNAKKKKKWPTGIDQMLQTSPGIRETVRMLLLLCSHFLMFRKSNSFWSEIGMNSKAIRMKLCSMNRLVLKKKNQMFQYTFHIDKKKKLRWKPKRACRHIPVLPELWGREELPGFKASLGYVA